MSFPANTTCYMVCAGTCQVHGFPNTLSPGYATSFLVSPGPSPTLTAVTTHSRHPSPLLTASPLPQVPPLSPSFAIINVPNTRHSHPPSPVIPTMALTPSVNPLVAHDSDPHHDKVHYDISKDLSEIYVSKVPGTGPRITFEQERYRVVEGPSPKNYHVAFDHPFFMRTKRFNGTPRIKDLLEWLHSYFHERVTAGEESDLKGDMDLYQLAVTTQRKRCGATADRKAEWDKGMKRVDILGKECKFRGIYLDTSAIKDHLTLRVVFGK